MAKDPAFLFYSNDFYEGTRTMLPEERACYVDLMIYQHQRGIIPNDLKRVLLYCNGIDEATLKATLEAKFKLTDKGWINEKLESIIELRQEYSSIQSINGTIGQFWKKAKAILDKNDYLKLKQCLYNQTKQQLFDEIKDKNINKATLQAMLEASLKHKHIENEIENEIIDINNSKEGVQREETEIEEYEFYPFEEFWNDYDKKVGEKEKLSRKWEKVSIKDRKAIKEYIPKYKAHQPDKKFRKNPETFLNNKGWNDELISALPVVRGQVRHQKGVSIADTQKIYEELTGNYGHR